MNYHKVYMNHVHSSSLLCQLASMWKSQTLCDAIIKTGNVVTKAHRVILVASCPMLQSMENATSGSHLEVRLSSDIKQHAVNTFLQYLYEGYLTLTEDNCRDVEKIARILQAESVIQCCSDFHKSLKSSLSGQYKYSFPEQTEFRHVRASNFLKVQDKIQKRPTHSSFPQSGYGKRQRLQESFSPSFTGSLSGSEENSGTSDHWDRVQGTGVQPGVIDIREDTVEFVQTEPPGQTRTNKQSSSVHSSVSISVASQHNVGIDKRIISVNEDAPPSTSVSAPTESVRRIQRDSPNKGSQEMHSMKHPHQSYSDSSRIPKLNIGCQPSVENMSVISTHGPSESFSRGRQNISETNIHSSYNSNIKTFPVTPVSPGSSSSSVGQVYPVALTEVSRSSQQQLHSTVPYAAGSENQTGVSDRSSRPTHVTPRKVSQSLSSGSTDTSWPTPISKSSSFDISGGGTIDLTSDTAVVKSELSDNHPQEAISQPVVSASNTPAQGQSDIREVDQSSLETYHFEEPPGDWSLGNISDDGNLTTGDCSHLDNTQGSEGYYEIYKNQRAPKYQPSEIPYQAVSGGSFAQGSGPNNSNDDVILVSHDVTQKPISRLGESQVPKGKSVKIPGANRCQFCCLYFPTMSLLCQHVKESHKDMKWIKICEHCGKVFQSHHGYRTHVRMYHLNREFPECKVCGKRFSSQSHLAVHEIKHSSDRAFSCVHCSRSFKYHSTLKNHICPKVRK